MNDALHRLAVELDLDSPAQQRLRYAFGHAAVSATYAVARAVAGKALQAVDYAAYAAVYGQGGYGAVADRESFEPEHAWQVDCLASLGASEPIGG